MASTQTFNSDLSAAATARNKFSSSIDNYGAFSGTQITAHINHVQIGTLMGVSYTVHTEKQGQYTMGSPNVRRFVTGKRGIAGTLVFNTFDRSALLAIFGGSNFQNQPLIANTLGNDQYSLGNAALAKAVGLSDSADDKFSRNFGVPFYSDTAGLTIPIQNDVQDAYFNAFSAPMDYTDMLPPFNVNLAMVDTQGAAAAMSLIGVEIMNEGGGYTVDDLTNQTAYTFVAKALRPLIPVGVNGSPSGTMPYTTLQSPISLAS